MNLQQLREDPATWTILAERAQALAHQEATKQTQLGEETVIFRLGAGRYGIDARLVREVLPLAGYTPLPGTPPFVLGLINLRGRLLAALDIRPLLGAAAHPHDQHAALLIVAASGIEVGLLADAVIEIRPCDLHLSPALPSIQGQVLAWVRGVDARLTVLLDLALLLADPQLRVGDAGER